MANIKAFINAAPTGTKEIIVSERFKDDNGNVVPFKIRTLTQDESEQLRKKSTRPVKKNGVVISESVDTLALTKETILACVVEPDLRNPELNKAYGTLDPLDVAGKMLLPGEYSKLSNAILEFNGFGEDATEILAEEAKNS